MLLAATGTSLFAQDNYVLGSLPTYGEKSVPLTTTVKFLFNNELYAYENESDLLESIIPIPYNEVDVLAVRISNSNRIIELDVIHRPNTDYYWVLSGIRFANGSTLSRASVPYYTTRSVLNPTSVNGFVEIIDGSSELFSKKMMALQSTANADALKEKLRDIASNSTATADVNHEISKAVVVLSNTILDDELEDDYSSIRAAGSVNHEGMYSVRNVKPGAYYVYGIYATDDGFAFGFYDENQDGIPDMISVTYESLNFIDFTMSPLPSFEFDDITSEEVFAEVHAMAIAEHADARLVLVEGNEFVLPPTLSDTRENRGKAFFWTYVYYSPDADIAFAVIAGKVFKMVVVVDNHMHGRHISEFATIETYDMKSDIVAHYAYAYAGSNFIQGLPEDAQLYVSYEMSRITSKYPDVLSNPNTTYWEVYFEATFTDQFGNGYHRDLTVLIDAYTGVLLFTSVPTSIENPTEEQPTSIELSQNYPNPFNPSTKISFNLPLSSHVKLTVYDMVGKEVATLADGMFPVGTNNLSWDAANMASGVYIYRLQAGDQILVRKMTLMK